MSKRDDIFQQSMSAGHSAAWDQDWDRAVEHYRQALKVIPQHPRALTSLGLALYELGQYEQSLTFYQQAAQVSPDDPLPLEKVAELSEKLGKFEHIAVISVRAADLYLKRRDPDRALENLSRIARVKPGYIPAHTRLAMIYERMGRKDQAVNEYLALASLMQHSGDMEKAIQAVNRALQIAPKSNEARRALKMLQESKPLPRPSRAPVLPEQAVQEQIRKHMRPGESKTAKDENLDPIEEARQRALAVLAGILFESPAETQEMQPAARRDIQSLVRGGAEVLFSKQADQTKIMLHVSQAIDLQTRGEVDQAAEELERATEAGLEHPAAFFDLGLLRVRGERLESAQRHLQQAVKHEGFALGGRLLLGQTLRKMERVAEAAIHYLEALKWADASVIPQEQADELLQIYEPLIEAESQQTDLESKQTLCANIEDLLVRPGWREHLAQARQDLPGESDGGPPKPLGEILTQARSSQIVTSISIIHKLAREGNLRSAMEEAFYALQHAPTYLPLHVYVGDLLLQQDHLAAAMNKYSVVAQTYSARGETARAIEMLRRVIRLAPMDLKARSRLIDQLLAWGKMDEAIKQYIDLADVYYNLADLNQARETYTEALRLAQHGRIDSSLKIQILHQIADIDLQSLDWRRALRIYEQVRKLQPGDHKAASRLVELNFRLGQREQAIAEMKDYVSQLQRNGKMDQAITFLEELVEENPGQVPIQHYLAQLYVQLNRVEEALHHLDSVGERLLKVGDRQAAAQVVETILSLNPPNKENYQRLLAKIHGRQSSSLK